MGNFEGYPHNQPVAQKLAQDGTQNDRNKDPAVKGHDDQHEQVSNTQGDAMYDGTTQLLQRGSAKGRVLSA